MYPLDGVKPKIKLYDGTYVVTLAVSDGQGGTATDSVTIHVVDSVPPVFTSLTAKPKTLWPPNRKMVKVKLYPKTKDNCWLGPEYKIISVKSNEPVTGSGDTTSPDWVVTGDRTLNLRAERRKTGYGRVYTITLQAKDNSGNTASRKVTVRVPKSYWWW
jgi:hypothetical protein